MMFWYDHGIGGWGWFAMFVGMLLLWALIIVGVVLLVRILVRRDERGSDERGSLEPRASENAGTTHRGAGPTPEQVLADRFARGDIDEQEYLARLATLRGTDRPGRH